MATSIVERLAPRLTEMEARVAEIDRLLALQKNAEDTARVAALLRERAGLAKRVELYGTWKRARSASDDARSTLLTERDSEMQELFSAEIAVQDAARAAAEAALVELFISDDGDAGRNVILEIRAGTGGDEAALWAGDLLRMYTRYSDACGFNVELLSESPTALGGYREVILGISGAGAYGRLKYESGGHRVQRVPTTETQGRIHTSAATVAVLPEVSEIEVNVKDGDLKIDTFRSSGPGGQSVNKTSSAIRITHLPSGLVVVCQDERSQHKNRARAMSILRSRLYESQREERDRKRALERREIVGSGDRSERIRTYNFPQNRATDHRTNITVHALDRVLEGGLDPLIQPLVDGDREAAIRDLLRAEGG